MLAVLLAQAEHGGNAAAAGIGAVFLVLVFIVLGLVGLGIYFLPSIIGFTRRKQNAVAIFALNFFLGWSLIGWVVSLVWALANENANQQVIVYNQGQPAGTYPLAEPSSPPPPGQT